MTLSSIDLAIKYHSLEDEEWEKNGAVSVVIASNTFMFKNKAFDSKAELFEFISNQAPKDVLILYNNETQPDLIADTLTHCKETGLDKLTIKGIEVYGR